MLEHEAIHFAFVKEKGWSVETLKKYLEAAKGDCKIAQEENKKIKAEDVKKEINKICEEIKSENDLNKIKEQTEQINEKISVSSSVELKSCSWEDYMDDINKYDPDQEFYPKLFTVINKETNEIDFQLPFPPQTLSVVGARTKRGKTIMLVNLALDAIESGRKCIFISLEMTRRQLLNKLILLRTYSQAVKDKNDTRLNILKKQPTPSSSLYKFFKNKSKENTGNEYKTSQNDTLNLMFEEAKTFIQEKMEKGKFELIEAFLAEHDQIIRKVSQADKGTLVTIDYIQRMPEEDGCDYDGGYMRITKINKALINATFKSEAITICAAQFNRMSGTDNGGSDTFDDTSFKESGSIEQDAHNAIGIGREKNKEGRFYEILKARESNGTGKQFSLEFNGAYSYMENKGKREKTEETTEAQKTRGKKEKKTKNPVPTMGNWNDR